MSTPPVVELVRAWVVERPDGHLRLMVCGLVNGREREALLMSSESRPGETTYSRVAVLDAHRQLRKQIAGRAR